MNRLEDLREDKDLLQKDIALLMKVSRNTISQYETETRDLSVNLLKQFSKLYETSIDYILYRTDIRTPYEKTNIKYNNITRLKELRKNNNKTQKQVSLDLKIPLKTYIQYENNIIGLNTKLLNKFANYYNTSIDYLLYLTDNIIPNKQSIIKE